MGWDTDFRMVCGDVVLQAGGVSEYIQYLSADVSLAAFGPVEKRHASASRISK